MQCNITTVLYCIVPGRGEVALSCRLPKNEKWRSAIVAVNNIPSVHKKLSSTSNLVIKQLIERDNISRKQKSFLKTIRKNFPDANDEVKNELWDAISEMDKKLYAVPYNTINRSDLSVATMLSEELGYKVHVVHRYYCNGTVISFIL